jgi:hypothetical protein
VAKSSAIPRLSYHRHSVVQQLEDFISDIVPVEPSITAAGAGQDHAIRPAPIHSMRQFHAASLDETKIGFPAPMMLNGKAEDLICTKRVNVIAESLDPVSECHRKLSKSVLRLQCHTSPHHCTAITTNVSIRGDADPFTCVVVVPQIAVCFPHG